MWCPDAQRFPIEQLDNLRGKQSLHLFNISVTMTQIAENIPAAANDLQRFALHDNDSFNLRIRSATNSNSGEGQRNFQNA
jgi:hypothetical protein